MSAPLVVNTVDGTVWTRRDAVRDGLALYAPEKCGQCPEFVMATYAELEAQGIVDAADALPMPVAPEPQALSAGRPAEFEAVVGVYAGHPEIGFACCSAHGAADAAAILLAEVRRQAAQIAEFEALELGAPDGRVSAACGNPEHPTWLRKPDDTRACPWCAVAELEAQRERRRVRLVALQNDALSMRGSLSPNGEDSKVPFPLGETLTPAVDWLIARVAELEAERKKYVGVEPTIAEEMAYLSRCLDAVYDLCDETAAKGITSGGPFTVEAVRIAADGDRPAVSRPALPWAHVMSDHDLHGFLDDLVSAAMGRWRSEPEVPDRVVLADIEKVCADWQTPGVGSRLDGSEFDGVTVRLVEPQPEFHAWLHHENRLGHDLPETGGTQC